MITTSKNIIPATTNPFLEAKNNLKKIASDNYTKPSVPLEQEEPVIQQEDQQERTLALLSCTDNLDEIIDYIKKEGFTVIQTKIIQYSKEQAEEFYTDHATHNYYDKMVRWLSNGSNVCALVLEKENAVTDWRLLMGPTTYKKARKSYPNSIRALFGKDASQNATHGSDSDVSSKKEIDFIFGHSSLVPDAANLPHVKYDGMNFATVEHDITEKSNTLLVTEAVSQTEESDVTEQKPPPTAADAKEASSPIDEKESATIAEIIPVTPVCTVTGIVDETPVLTADDKQEDRIADITPTIIKTVSPAVVTEGELKSNDFASATIDNDLKVEETIPVSASDNLTAEESVITDKGIKTDTVASVNIVEEASPKEITPAITTTDNDLKKKEDVQAIIEEAVVNKKEPVSVDNNLKNQENISTIIEEPSKDAATKSIVVDISLKDQEAEPTVTEVIETKNTPREPVDTTAIVDDSPRDCITMTPTVSTKDEEAPTLTYNNTENKLQDVLVEEGKDVVSDKPDLSTNVKDTDITPMTPPAEMNNASNVSSSFTLESKAPKKDSKTPSLRSNSIEKKSPLARKTSVKSEVKSETIIPSSSRIRPPSIKRGHNGAMVRSGEPIGRSRISNNKIDSANSSAGTTRIARLSPSATLKNEQPVPATEKKKPAIARETVKKPATKVSKNLPRVATIVNQKIPIKEEVDEAEKKPKKRGSSTKSFITRLTAPTVASQNKKADSEPVTPVSRRATLPTKRSSAVGPASSASKEITTRNKQ
ncbi:hypothetical protein EDC94DRAFT_149217 [Helicostylum pulchrum]|nr:hypothetical protein EDC94DRAFT_149217 [Helicostylum pulchrum]